MSYASDLNPTSCTQPKRGMIAGRGGGHGYDVGDVERLRRFLILGHEGGTYYATQRKLTFETVDCLDRLPVDLSISMIAQISDEGRAPKNDPAIFALAYLVSKGHSEALSVLPTVCRIGTHLFQFLTYCKQLGKGWGSGFRRAINDWYLCRSPLAVAKQVTKYQGRCGWTHRDVFRKSHPQGDYNMNGVFRYVTQPDAWKTETRQFDDAAQYLIAVERAKYASIHDLCKLIRKYRLPREVIPTERLNNKDVWMALLESMPLTAMIRNLGKMSNIELVQPLSNASKMVVAALQDREKLRAQRVHPLALLIAQRTYARGRGVRGSLSWSPDQSVLRALDDAFYAAFDFVEPTGKNFLLGVDVSSSMSWSGCRGCDVLKPFEAAAAMAMLAVRTEPWCQITAFCHKLTELNITANDSLGRVLDIMAHLNFGSTRVAAPIEYATQRGLDVDVFCVYTDNETNFGQHPSSALQFYRKQKPGAKLAVFGLAQTNFTVADPNDPGMMDFVGFDTAAPTLLADFARS